MKSIFIILILYIALYWYGSNIKIPTVTRDNKELENSLIFNENHLSIFNDTGDKTADIKCKKVVIKSDTQQNFEDVHIHMFKTKQNKKISTKSKFSDEINDDLYLDARKGTYDKAKDSFILEENVQITIGDSTYFKSNKVTIINENQIEFPSLIYLQRDGNIYTGELATYNTDKSNATIEKDIHCFFKMMKKSLNKQKKTPLLTELKSAGPLVFNGLKKEIMIQSKTIIENKEMIIKCNQAKLFLDEQNSLERIESVGLVQIEIKNKNITATAPKAYINLKTNIFTLKSTKNKKPFIIINEYKQTASYIIFDNNTEILKAGPIVESIKIKKSKSK